MVESDFSPFFFSFLKDTAANLKVFPKRLNAKFSSTCVLFSSQTSVQTTSIQHGKKINKFGTEPRRLSRAPPRCLFFSFFLPFSSPDANTQRERTRCKKITTHFQRASTNLHLFTRFPFASEATTHKAAQRFSTLCSPPPRHVSRGKSANVAPVTH